MSVRDLLTFNLFLQLTDGLVSYQAFALGAAEANPVVAAAIVNWGMIGGLIYNKALACLLLLLILIRRNRHLITMRALTVTASVYVRHLLFVSGNSHDNTVETPLTPLVALMCRLGSIPRRAKALRQLPASSASACQCRNFTACFHEDKPPCPLHPQKTSDNFLLAPTAQDFHPS
jgi:hypothetical protein